MKPMIRFYVKDKKTGAAIRGPYADKDLADVEVTDAETQAVVAQDIHKLRVHPTLSPIPGWCVDPEGSPYKVFPRVERRRLEAQSHYAFYYTLYPQFTKKQTTKADRRRLRNISKQSRKVNYG